MVATPYTKLMTAVMDVDMAAAVLVATEARADELGVPRDRRVYLWGSGVAEEPPTMAVAARAVAVAGPGARRRTVRWVPVGIDDVAHLDLYSCFAASLQFARDALGITDDRALTVTGGLPYHGGPGSNYATHALAAMVETLRTRPRAPWTRHRGRDAHASTMRPPCGPPPPRPRSPSPPATRTR